MTENDLDLLYERTAEHDRARPGTAVREAILEQARQLAAHAHQQQPDTAETQSQGGGRGRASRAGPSYLLRGFAHWLRVRWQIAAPLAAAVLAVIVLQPQLRSKLPASARQSSAPASATTSDSELVPPQTANVPETPPVAGRARSAPEPFPAESGLPRSDFSSAPAGPSSAATAPPTAAPPPAPPAARPATASNLASSADLAALENRASGTAPMRSRRSAAPPVGLRERAEAQSETSGARAASDSELLQAAARGDVARVRSLVQMNAASINARDTRGRTALLLAVLHRHESVVRALLQGGADPNIGDADGRTPLAVARDQNQLPVAEALLQAGARASR
jgi:Ankyrin repeats (3 copies)